MLIDRSEFRAWSSLRTKVTIDAWSMSHFPFSPNPGSYPRIQMAPYNLVQGVINRIIISRSFLFSLFPSLMTHHHTCFWEIHVFFLDHWVIITSYIYIYISVFLAVLLSFHFYQRRQSLDFFLLSRVNPLSYWHVYLYTNQKDWFWIAAAVQFVNRSCTCVISLSFRDVTVRLSIQKTVCKLHCKTPMVLFGLMWCVVY